jgi:hypothetical protein
VTFGGAVNGGAAARALDTALPISEEATVRNKPSLSENLVARSPLTDAIRASLRRRDAGGRRGCP